MVRLNSMTKSKFLNMAWQLFVDRVQRRDNGTSLTTEAPIIPSSSSVPHHSGSLENAIRSAHPQLVSPRIAAEEVVDSCLVEEVAQQRIPYQVFSPVTVPEHTTHGKVVEVRKPA